MNAPSPSQPCRVAIVEDHTFMREGIKLFVSTTADFSWAWMAASTAEGMEMLAKDLPDLLLVDITLPDRNGLELIKDAHALYPKLQMIVLTMHDEKLYAHRALKAGARGYLRKDALHAEYEKAFRRVKAGGIYVSESMSADIVLAYATGGGLSSGADDELGQLTDRELEVFRLLGEGQSTHEVAEILRISPKTVDVHKMNIKTKLTLEDGSAVVRRAIRWHEAKRLSGM
ncbi:MAG: response regulator transcription factor [Verrucomicrobiota bacterium]